MRGSIIRRWSPRFNATQCFPKKDKVPPCKSLIHAAPCDSRATGLGMLAHATLPIRAAWSAMEMCKEFLAELSRFSQSTSMSLTTSSPGLALKTLEMLNR